MIDRAGNSDGPTCEFEVNSPSQGRLRIGPFSGHHAERFGAALRKTLIRDTEGACVAAVRIDRDYSPVERVAINIEESDDGGMLSLEVTTDGTVKPAEAMAQAASLLTSKPDAGDDAAAWCTSVLRAAGAPREQEVAAAVVPEPRTRTFGGNFTDVSIPDLVELQKRSYGSFVQTSHDPRNRKVQGLERLLQNAFPACLANGEQLNYVGYELGEVEVDPCDCQRLGRTYAVPLRVLLQRVGDGGTLVVEACRLPMMTQRSTFVIGRLQAVEDTEYNDLVSRRLLLVGQQLESALAKPLVRDVEAMSRVEDVQDVVMAGFAEAVGKFFATSRFVHRAETTNPLSLVSHLRRVIQWGTSRRPGYEARGVHPNHFGRLCLLETPEGQRIGINLSLGILAGVDDEGRLTTPYRRTDDSGIEYVTSEQEADATIADLSPGKDYDRRYAGRTLARAADDITRIEPGEADYVPAHPSQGLGASASLIPFVAHDDPNRALMGTNMQKQAVPLIDPEAPLIRTGMEARVAGDAHMGVKAESDSVVTAVTATEIVAERRDGNRRAYPLVGMRGSSHGSCLRQRPCVRPGEKVAKGQILVDGPATDGGVLAVGKNVLVGYMPWEGYNFEDSIVISDRLVRDEVFTSLKVQEFVETVTKAAAETDKFACDHLPAETAAKLSPDGCVKEGTTVEGGDVLAAKNTLVEGPDGQKIKRDTSLRIPVGQRGTVIRVEHYAVDKDDSLEENISRLVRVTVAVRRPLKVGDKLANRHGVKGTVGLIVPEDEMPVLPDGRPLDLILNPLGVPSRMNIGQLLETHLGLAAHELNCTVITPAFNGASVEDVESMLAEAGLPTSGMFRLRDGRTGRVFDHECTVGYQYFMKLVHMIDDRWQVRSVGPYSSETKQPVGGRRNGGGQHIGIMETWALQGHGAAHTLQEMLTVKSDDVAARAEIYEPLVGRTELPKPTVPHSVRRLVRQLRGLCLDMKLFRADGRVIDPFLAGSSIEDAATAGVGFASPNTVRAWSAGDVVRDISNATFEELIGSDNRLSGIHLELAAPVRHPWRIAVGKAARDVPEIEALPILPRGLRGGSALDRDYIAVCSANAAVRREGATDRTLAALQAAVDQLLGDPQAGRGLTALLYGKRGWVTAAVSGKTVDYSARSVASPGCDLSYDQCGLPRSIATGLFEPIIVGELMRAGLATTPETAKRMLHDHDPKAIEVLREVAKDRYVLLHRAPVLHRMGIQAFRPVITEEDVVRVHPLTMRTFVCAVPSMQRPGEKPERRETIVGGLPRLDELFEAGKRPGQEVSNEGGNLLEMLSADGAMATAEYLLTEIHRVYRRQGVRIDEKHCEIVLREVLGRMRIKDPGETMLERGELVTTAQLQASNAATTGKPASGEPTIVGISEAAVCTADLIAAAVSYGGIPTLAKLAARNQTIELTRIRNCAAFGKLASRD